MEVEHMVPSYPPEAYSNWYFNKATEAPGSSVKQISDDDLEQNFKTHIR